MNIGFDLRSIIGKPIFGSDSPAGVAKYASNILRKMVSLNPEHDFFCFFNSFKRPNTSLIDDVLSKRNVHLITTGVPNKLFDPMAKVVNQPKIDKIIKKIKGDDIDVYFSPHLNISPLTEKVRHVMTVHDLSFELYPEFYGMRKLYWHWVQNVRSQCLDADAIIAVSENTKYDLIDLYGIDENKIHVVHSGMPIRAKEDEDGKKDMLEKVRVKYGIPSDYFLYIGTLEPRKNIESIIEAYSNSRISETSLVIAGGKGWKYCQIYKTANKSKRKNNIYFTGYVDEIDKSALIENARACIYPSFYEGFGFPPLEAISRNTTVITSHVSSIPEIVGTRAVYVDPYNINDITCAMNTVLSEKENRSNSPNYNIEYSWDVAVEKTIDIIMARHIS